MFPSPYGSGDRPHLPAHMIAGSHQFSAAVRFFKKILELLALFDRGLRLTE